MTTSIQDTHQLVQDCLADGRGLRVELDPGEIELYGQDLRETWDALAPGEPFVVLEVLPKPDTLTDTEREEARTYAREVASEVAEIINDQVQIGVLWSLGAHKFRATVTANNLPAAAWTVRVLPFRKDGTRGTQARNMSLTVALNGMDYYDITVTYPSTRTGETVTHLEYSDVDVFNLNRILLSIDSDTDRDAS